MPKIKLSLLNQITDKTILNNLEIKKNFKEWINSVLTVENFVENVEISVLLTDNKKIRNLNKDFRGIDKNTDVLSFPMGEHSVDSGYYNLGDIAISVDKAIEQSEQYGHSLTRELAFLIIHSVLHLLGYDHLDDEGELQMRQKQTEILNKLGLGIKNEN